MTANPLGELEATPFDSLIDRQEAIDRLAKAQPVFATFRGGGQDTVTAIFADEILTLTSVRGLADVAFFSSCWMLEESSRFDFDGKQLKTTVP
jgi:hypothetical protein